MPPGTYLAAADGRRQRLTVLADGRLQLEGGDHMAFAPLDAEGSRFAVWASGETGDRDDGEDMGVYTLLRRQTDGSYLLFVPDCAATQAIARAAGASVEDRSGVPFCRFPDRASLEAGLRRLDPSPDSARMKLSPLGGAQQ